MTGTTAPDDTTVCLATAALPEQHSLDASREARGTSARLIKKIFEADPLLCTCGGRMRIISITNPRVVNRIMRHRESRRCKIPGAHSIRDRLPAHQQNFRNNSKAAADVRLSNQTCSAGVRLIAVAVIGEAPREQAWQGSDRSSISGMQHFPIQSLPGLFPTALFPVSWPIPPGFLLPFRIEIPLTRRLRKRWTCA